MATEPLVWSSVLKKKWDWIFASLFCMDVTWEEAEVGAIDDHAVVEL